MEIKRKKTGTSAHANDADVEDTRNEASQEASSHGDPSAYLTRNEMNGVLTELRDQMARQDDRLQKQQEMIDQFFARMDGRPSNAQVIGNEATEAARASHGLGGNPLVTENA